MSDKRKLLLTELLELKTCKYIGGYTYKTLEKKILMCDKTECFYALKKQVDNLKEKCIRKQDLRIEK